MTAKVELAQSVQLVLLAMLQALQEAVAERYFGRDPGIGLRVAGIPAGHEVGIAIVSGELQKGGSALSRHIRGREIDGVVALAHVEGAAIDGDGFNDGRNQEVGISVAVAVGVGGKIVRVEIAADLKE